MDVHIFYNYLTYPISLRMCGTLVLKLIKKLIVPLFFTTLVPVPSNSETLTQILFVMTQNLDISIYQGTILTFPSECCILKIQ